MHGRDRPPNRTAVEHDAAVVSTVGDVYIANGCTQYGKWYRAGSVECRVVQCDDDQRVFAGGTRLRPDYEGGGSGRDDYGYQRGGDFQEQATAYRKFIRRGVITTARS